jgi:DNA-binding PadR family transcriptional regulator
MRADSLGELQARVLHAVLRLGSGAYGLAIHEEVETERSLSIGALYTTLDRLEDRGYLSSWSGEPTPERGGKRKRYFRVEAAGEAALRDYVQRAAKFVEAFGFSEGV